MSTSDADREAWLLAILYDPRPHPAAAELAAVERLLDAAGVPRGRVNPKPGHLEYQLVMDDLESPWSPEEPTAEQQFNADRNARYYRSRWVEPEDQDLTPSERVALLLDRLDPPRRWDGSVAPLEKLAPRKTAG